LHFPGEIAGEDSNGGKGCSSQTAGLRSRSKHFRAAFASSHSISELLCLRACGAAFRAAVFKIKQLEHLFSSLCMNCDLPLRA
jgi:hypothetical protein